MTHQQAMIGLGVLAYVTFALAVWALLKGASILDRRRKAREAERERQRIAQELRAGLRLDEVLAIIEPREPRHFTDGQEYNCSIVNPKLRW